MKKEHRQFIDGLRKVSGNKKDGVYIIDDIRVSRWEENPDKVINIGGRRFVKQEAIALILILGELIEGMEDCGVDH